MVVVNFILRVVLHIWFLLLYASCSSQFALRSYLYILFHELVGRPASFLYDGEKVRALSMPFELFSSHFLLKYNCSESESFCLQVRVFYAVRLFLGLISVITETILVYALSRKYGKRLASYTLAMLCLTSGCFFASTSAWPFFFLPGFLILVLSECYFFYLSQGSYSMK